MLKYTLLKEVKELKKRFLCVLLAIIFCLNTVVYGDTPKIPVYKVQAFLSGFVETILYGSEDGYSDFCTNEAALNETDRKQLFINGAEQSMGLAYVDKSEVTVSLAKGNEGKYGTRFLISCYIIKAQHSPQGFDYYKMEIDLSVNLIEGKKKITKVYGKKMVEIRPELLPKDLKTKLDNGLKSQLPIDYMQIKGSKEGWAKGTLSDLINKGILVKKRAALNRTEKGEYELAVGQENDEQYEYWEQYYNYEVTFIKPQDNTKWKEYTKYKGFTANVQVRDKPVNYTYTSIKGVKLTGKLAVGSVVWDIKNCDLTKPFTFSDPFVITGIILK